MSRGSNERKCGPHDNCGGSRSFKEERNGVCAFIFNMSHLACKIPLNKGLKALHAAKKYNNLRLCFHTHKV